MSSITVERISPGNREMVGVFQHGSGAPHQKCFMLCRPLGQEAVRTATVFRVIADRIAREGCGSLRFDFHGTGDSPGNEGDQGMAHWVADVLAAHEHLAQSGRQPDVWFGMGLSATVAVEAAILAVRPPRRLILWDPVLDGAVYTQAMLAAHRLELSREYGLSWEQLVSDGTVTEPALPGDVLGFNIGAQLASDLKELQFPSIQSVLHRGVEISCSVRGEQLALFSPLLGHSQFSLGTIEFPINWMLSQALGTSIVPPDLMSTCMANLN